MRSEVRVKGSNSGHERAGDGGRPKIDTKQVEFKRLRLFGAQSLLLMV